MARFNFDHPQIEHPALPAFAELARKFCSLVEARFTVDVSSLQSELHGLMALLYAGGLQLPPTDILYDDEDDDGDDDCDDLDPARDLSTRDPDRLDQNSSRQLYADLAHLFDNNLYYREIFDPYPVSSEEPAVVGSLADDILDIYRDLRSGLLKWDRGESGPALWEWRSNFEVHWGEHATSALRALHSLAAFHDGQWPILAHDQRQSNIGVKLSGGLRQQDDAG